MKLTVILMVGNVFFYNRVVDIWNSLPETIVCNCNIPIFKRIVGWQMLILISLYELICYLFMCL